MRTMYLLRVLSLLLPVPAVIAKIFTDPAQLTQHEYDFVVVGGGTAGNVIANRLSENPAVSVLVIEAGGSNSGIIETMIPFTAANVLSNASLIWNYTTVPQQGLAHRSIPYQRGRVLGGSSTINFLVYTRGSRDDFDRYARVTGEPGWSWDSVFPFMLKAENFTAPVDHHDTTGEFNSSVHGFHGPLLTSLPGFPSDIDGRILGTTQSDPESFPFNLDSNSGDTLGISWITSTTGLGERSSSATAYLQPVLQRPNLDVLIQTQVTRLINIAEEHEIPDLRRVEFSQTSTSQRKIVHARKEVVLSAGALNTPQILLLSGVGETKKLSALGISTVWFVRSNETLDDILRNATLAEDLLEQWEETRTGPLTDAGGNLFGWLRVPDNSSVFDGFGDPSAGPTSSHMELFPSNLFVSFTGRAPPPTGSFITITTNVASPMSRGSVSLKSSHPFDFPVIDPGLMTHALDVAIMMEAVRTSERLLATTPWKGFVKSAFGALANATTDAALEQYVRDETTTFWHPCCTAKMGAPDDDMAVVDAMLRLKGARGVRVVDASVFPFIPAAHLQAPVYAIAERAAHLMQTAWSP